MYIYIYIACLTCQVTGCNRHTGGAYIHKTHERKLTRVSHDHTNQSRQREAPKEASDVRLTGENVHPDSCDQR